MFDQDDFETAKEEAKELLKVALQGVTATVFPAPAVFTLNPSTDLDPEQIEKKLTDVPAGYKKVYEHADFIYIIQLDENQPGKMKELEEQFNKAREGAKDYAKPNEQPHPTHTLYVGRSKHLRQRMRQHLGKDNAGTYALHMSRWAKSIDVDLVIYYLEFDGLDNLVVQAIEDGIWAAQSPAFGKKGAH